MSRHVMSCHVTSRHQPQWGTFTYTVSNGITTSPPAIVTLVPLTGAIVGSTFLMGNEGWGVSGNKLTGAMATSEPYSRGLLNHYIYGTGVIESNYLVHPVSIDSPLYIF